MGEGRRRLEYSPTPSITSNLINYSEMVNILTNLTDIYQIILELSMPYKFLTDNSDLSVSLPFVTNKQFSAIEYSVMDHCCYFKGPSALTFYTFQFRRLHFLDTDDNYANTVKPPLDGHLRDFFKSPTLRRCPP